MARRSMAPDRIVAVLGESPERIATITAALTPAQVDEAPAPGEWSANEVLAHLRSCADVWGACMATIIGADRPTIRAVNPTTYIDGTDYVARPFRTSLGEFTAQRRDLLAELDALLPEGWAREATITGAGAPLVRSVQDYGHRLASHERAHWKQFGKIVDLLA